MKKVLLKMILTKFLIFKVNKFKVVLRNFLSRFLKRTLLPEMTIITNN